MTVQCASLYEDVVGEVGAGTGSQRLVAAFVRAFNRTLDKLSNAEDRATPHTHVDSQDGSVSTIDDNLEYVLYAGVLFYLNRSGYGPRDPKLAAIVYRDTRDNWVDAIADYMTAIDNAIQADSDADMIALGNLG